MRSNPNSQVGFRLAVSVFLPIARVYQEKAERAGFAHPPNRTSAIKNCNSNPRIRPVECAG